MSCFGYNYCYYFSYNRRQPKTIIKKKKLRFYCNRLNKNLLNFFFTIFLKFNAIFSIFSGIILHLFMDIHKWILVDCCISNRCIYTVHHIFESQDIPHCCRNDLVDWVPNQRNQNLDLLLAKRILLCLCLCHMPKNHYRYLDNEYIYTIKWYKMMNVLKKNIFLT